MIQRGPGCGDVNAGKGEEAHSASTCLDHVVIASEREVCTSHCDGKIWKRRDLLAVDCVLLRVEEEWLGANLGCKRLDISRRPSEDGGTGIDNDFCRRCDGSHALKRKRVQPSLPVGIRGQLDVVISPVKCSCRCRQW